MPLDASGASYLLLQPGDRRWQLANGPSWAIGRGDGCAVMLEGRSVSRLHALIQRREGGDFSLVDLGSRNGSFVNGRRVSLPVLLRDADRLVFGDQEAVFHNPTPGGPAAGEDFNTRDAPTTALHTHTLTTIAVVDIRDYTPLARSVSEALLSQAIGTWFLRVGQIVGRLGSWAQRYIGDAVMAVWVHEEGAALDADLRRVLRAVSEIDIATGELHKTLPLPGPLRVGAGINTGPAIVGGAEFTALGDTVNAAFRLEEATKQLGLGVALGERAFTELRVPNGSPFQRRQVTLKGYDEPATAWGISFEDLDRFLKG
ncbi:MAG: adenylate/guanylate cyclase domain-containing protein [Bryobacteraceae bacterium]|jgi:adenylate cyclase